MRLLRGGPARLLRPVAVTRSGLFGPPCARARTQTGAASSIAERRCDAQRRQEPRLGKQDDTAGWAPLFTAVETRLRNHDRRLAAPTAVLRLEAAIEAAANAEVRISALRTWARTKPRSGGRGDLAQRCLMQEAALGDARRCGLVRSAEIQSERTGGKLGLSDRLVGEEAGRANPPRVRRGSASLAHRGRRLPAARSRRGAGCLRWLARGRPS